MDRIVAGEQAPVDPFPVGGRDGPVFLGGVEDPPPEFHIVGLAEGLLGVDGDDDVGPFLVHRHVEAGAGLLFVVFHLHAQFRQEEEEVIPGNPQVVAPLEIHHGALVDRPRHLVPLPGGPAGAEGLEQLDTHGTLILAPAAQGADPGPFGIDDLLLQAQDDSPDRLPGVPAGDQAGGRTTAGAGAAGITAVRQLGGDVPDFAVLSGLPLTSANCLFCHVSSLWVYSINFSTRALPTLNSGILARGSKASELVSTFGGFSPK